MKTVYKPWGTEVWIELNDWYCYKRIYIKQGHRTSFQYHEKKRETNYIIQGDAELWLENESGYIEKRQLGSDDHFTVFPLRKHRIIAKTDLILQEVSTPEVDDVIRVEDDTHREDGRIEHEHKQPAVCILAAGKGSRLKNIGEEIHKALLPIENKAVISHLIEKIPPDFDIIVATNYLEEMVQDYCNAAHPDRHITYVHVEHAEGPGSGPGMSLYACRELLQRPFLVTVSDCLIKGNLPDLDGDWIGIYPTGIPELYSTAKLDEHMKVVSCAEL
jgi:mannose-6-phosphate isomerase